MLAPHQQRVVEEVRDLDEKREKLQNFIHGDVCNKLAIAEQVRLARQLAAMNMYSAVLHERIAAF